MQEQWSANTELMGALEQLHPSCFAWALACCGRKRHQAEDVLQAAYEKVIGGRARFDGMSSLKTWFFGVIRLTAREHQRSRFWKELPVLGWWMPSEPRQPDEQFVGHEQCASLVQALKELSPKQQQVLHLVFQQELSIQEAAAVMGVSVGSARTHYERGKQSLFDRLRDQGMESS